MTGHNSFSFFPLVQNLWSRKNRNKKQSFTYSQIARLRRSLFVSDHLTFKPGVADALEGVNQVYACAVNAG